MQKICQSVLKKVLKYVETFLSTKLKIFCSKQLEITCNFTTLNTIAQNKNPGTKITDNKDNTFSLPITYKLEP